MAEVSRTTSTQTQRRYERPRTESQTEESAPAGAPAESAPADEAEAPPAEEPSAPPAEPQDSAELSEEAREETNAQELSQDAQTFVDNYDFYADPHADPDANDTENVNPGELASVAEGDYSPEALENHLNERAEGMEFENDEARQAWIEDERARVLETARNLNSNPEALDALNNADSGDALTGEGDDTIRRGDAERFAELTAAVADPEGSDNNTVRNLELYQEIFDNPDGGERDGRISGNDIGDLTDPEWYDNLDEEHQSAIDARIGDSLRAAGVLEEGEALTPELREQALEEIRATATTLDESEDLRNILSRAQDDGDHISSEDIDTVVGLGDNYESERFELPSETAAREEEEAAAAAAAEEEARAENPFYDLGYEATTFQIEPGDNVTAVLRQAGFDDQQIQDEGLIDLVAETNGLEDPNLIHPGQELVFPSVPPPADAQAEGAAPPDAIAQVLADPNLPPEARAYLEALAQAA